MFAFDELEARLNYPGRDTLAARLKVASSRLEKLRTEPLDAVDADELATAAGFHPSEIWPGWPDGPRL